MLKRLVPLMFLTLAVVTHAEQWFQLPSELGQIYSNQNQFAPYGFRIVGARLGQVSDVDGRTGTPGASALIWTLRADRDIRYYNIREMQDKFTDVLFQKEDNGARVTPLKSLLWYTIKEDTIYEPNQLMRTGEGMHIYIYLDENTKQRLIETRPNMANFGQ